jgi:hypothetical protein
VERDEDEQHVEGEGLFLSLTHTACRAHPERLLYPMDKKLLKGLLFIDHRIQIDALFSKLSSTPSTS